MDNGRNVGYSKRLFTSRPATAYAAKWLRGSVLVQSDQSEEHNQFLLEQASINNFIKGIVGWVDLRAAT
jgi:hypothetical protein